MGRREPQSADVPVICRHCGSDNLRYRLTHFVCLDCHQTSSLHHGPTKKQRRERKIR